MIRVQYFPGGRVVRTAEGYVGDQCREATGLYLLRQAGTVVSDVPHDDNAVRAGATEEHRVAAG